jgi:tetratricopeptide (TPR) repeat protein
LTHFITASVGLGTSIEKAKDDKVKALLEKAETQFTHSRYQEALKIVEQAVLIDPKNIRANELKEKLATVLQMLDSTPQASPEEESPQVNKDGVPLTPDEREELGGVSPKEVRP